MTASLNPAASAWVNTCVRESGEGCQRLGVPFLLLYCFSCVTPRAAPPPQAK